MTNKTKHTPTPWDRMGDLIIRVEGPASFDVAKVDSEANAAHIVKCVNLHDELVEALSELMKVYSEPDTEICCNGYHCGCQGASVRQQAEYYAREALKKAGAL